MTREEAITYLKVIWNRYKAEYEIERETLDAYHMAIEALSATNLKSEFESADAVSREAHYDAVANRITDMEERGFVSVVRCKDCRHYGIGNCYMYGGQMNEDDFCSYGERKK